MAVNNRTDQILIVDDVRTNRRILSSVLKDDYDIVEAESGQEAIDILESGRPIDLIMLDVMMPGMDGYEVLRLIRASDKFMGIPVILVTSLDSVDFEERGLFLGATDYIRKPIQPSLVKLRIKNQLSFVHQRKMLEELSEIDPLTELHNRRYFDKMIQREYRRASRTGTPIALAVIDIDFFKGVNDTYGHAVGDSVLRKVATTIDASVFRPGDVVARYGGEEFTVLLPHTSLPGATNVLENIRRAVEELAIENATSKCADVVTVSIGFAIDEGTYRGTAQLFETADNALYEAKRNGRNQVVNGSQNPALLTVG